MKKVLVIALLAVFAISCGAPEDKQKELKDLKTQYAELGKKIEALEKELKTEDTSVNETPIRVEAVSSKEFKRPVEIQGIVESDKNVVISSEVAGRVVEVLVKDGQKVTKGQTLVKVNGDIPANSIQEVENALKLAEITYKKQQNLYKQNVGTEMQLLQAENQRDALKKQLSTLRTQYGKYNITAPVTGVVDDVLVNVGENIMPGMPVGRVVNNNQLKVSANVSERYVTAVKRGDDVKVKFPGLDMEMTAKVSATGQIINPANRTFSMIVNLNKTSSVLKPNLLALVTIYDYINPNAISIPSNIIMNNGSEDYVYVLTKKGANYIAQKTNVKKGKISGAYTEILEGLKDGDKIIVENYKNLVDGSVVKVIK